RPDAEPAQNEPLAGIVASRRPANLRVDQMDARAAFLADCVSVRENKERGREAFAQLQNQSALDGEVERFEFAINDGKAACRNITVAGEKLETLLARDARYFTLAPSLLVATGKRT